MQTKLNETTVTVAADGARMNFVARNAGHVPYNKRRWEVESSTATLTVVDYDGSKAVNPEGWTEINLSETTQVNAGGPFQTRTISFYLHADDRKALIKMLGGRA